MTLLDRLKKRTNEPDEEILEDMLESAKSIILGRRFPFGWPPPIKDNFGNYTYGTCVEPRYEDLQLRIAEDMYNRIGASGQMSHSENGISRSWGSEWVSEELLQEITPYVGALK